MPRGFAHFEPRPGLPSPGPKRVELPDPAWEHCARLARRTREKAERYLELWRKEGLPGLKDGAKGELFEETVERITLNLTMPGRAPDAGTPAMRRAAQDFVKAREAYHRALKKSGA